MIDWPPADEHGIASTSLELEKGSEVDTEALLLKLLDDDGLTSARVPQPELEFDTEASLFHSFVLVSSACIFQSGFEDERQADAEASSPHLLVPASSACVAQPEFEDDPQVDTEGPSPHLLVLGAAFSSITIQSNVALLGEPIPFPQPRESSHLL